MPCTGALLPAGPRTISLRGIEGRPGEAIDLSKHGRPRYPAAFANVRYLSDVRSLYPLLLQPAAGRARTLALTLALTLTLSLTLALALTLTVTLTQAEPTGARTRSRSSSAPGRAQARPGASTSSLTSSRAAGERSPPRSVCR